MPNAIAVKSIRHNPDRKPKWSGDELRSQLALYDRRPFLDLLAEWLECSPDPEAIKKFAEKYPDRYAGAIRQLAQIGGFTEKREVSVDVHMNIRHMSDSQIEDRLQDLNKALGLSMPMIEGQKVVDES